MKPILRHTKKILFILLTLVAHHVNGGLPETVEESGDFCGREYLNLEDFLISHSVSLNEFKRWLYKICANSSKKSLTTEIYKQCLHDKRARTLLIILLTYMPTSPLGLPDCFPNRLALDTVLNSAVEKDNIALLRVIEDVHGSLFVQHLNTDFLGYNFDNDFSNCILKAIRQGRHQFLLFLMLSGYPVDLRIDFEIGDISGLELAVLYNNRRAVDLFLRQLTSPTSTQRIMNPNSELYGPTSFYTNRLYVADQALINMIEKFFENPRTLRSLCALRIWSALSNQYKRLLILLTNENQFLRRIILEELALLPDRDLAWEFSYRYAPSFPDVPYTLNGAYIPSSLEDPSTDENVLPETEEVSEATNALAEADANRADENVDEAEMNASQNHSVIAQEVGITDEESVTGGIEDPTQNNAELLQLIDVVFSNPKMSLKKM